MRYVVFMRSCWLIVSFVAIACAPEKPVELDTGVPSFDAGVQPCAIEGERLSCAHRTFEVAVAQPVPFKRVVHVGVPAGVAPTSGWPTVFLFQGSLYSAQLSWSAVPSDPIGAFWQTSTVRSLLDAGFAVVTPEVRYGGTTYWDTNIPQWSVMWSNAPDHHFMVALLDGVGAGTFGPLDATKLYAGGISSGGYMTSRMALSYAGRFKALAVHSASWATCGGPICVVPDSLPADHPPTLFLHGESDAVVPIGTMRTYEAKLVGQGVEVKTVTVAGKGHEWLEAGVLELPAFFAAHR